MEPIFLKIKKIIIIKMGISTLQKHSVPYLNLKKRDCPQPWNGEMPFAALNTCPQSTISLYYMKTF